MTRKGRMSKGLVLFLAVLLLSACSDAGRPEPVKPVRFTAPRVSDLENIWKNALVAIPVRGTTGSLLTTNAGRAGPPQKLAGVGPETRWPVIVVIGGCLQPVGADLLRALAEQGYVVLSPASQSRFFNPLSCQPDEGVEQNAQATIDIRKTEISYVLKKLHQQTWTDKSNLFLIGLRDGAAAVARYTGNNVQGRVLAEWTCGGSGAVAGIAVEDKSPVFAVTSSLTPTYAGDCSRYLRRGTGSQVLALPQKYSNNVLLEPVIHTQLLRFLDKRLFR